ncbi:MAG: nitroreductase family protein [Woeseiaceae bacterium]|nr:nitroreductase family protein [Woeseiaceae bacterium]
MTPQPADDTRRSLRLLAERIRARRTVNLFLKQPVSRQLVREAIEVARWAPNHHVTEPWHFYVLGEATIARAVELTREIVTERKGARKGRFKADAAAERPGWLVVTCARSDDELTQQELRRLLLRDPEPDALPVRGKRRVQVVHGADHAGRTISRPAGDRSGARIHRRTHLLWLSEDHAAAEARRHRRHHDRIALTQCRTVTVAPPVNAAVIPSTSSRSMSASIASSPAGVTSRPYHRNCLARASASSSLPCAALRARPSRWRLASAISSRVGGSSRSRLSSECSRPPRVSSLAGSTPTASVIQPSLPFER